jgi:hypothetical protein
MASNRPLPTTIGGGRGRPDSGGMLSLAHGGADAGGRLPAVTGAGSEAAKPRGARALCLTHDGADLPRRHRRLPSPLASAARLPPAQGGRFSAAVVRPRPAALHMCPPWRANFDLHKVGALD